MGRAKLNDRYDIIRLRPTGNYYEAAEEAPRMPRGKSRIGGPVSDLPPKFEPPDDMIFVAQLDLSWIAKHDKHGLLPNHGHLFFYFNYDGPRDVGLLHYFPGEAKELRRTEHEHERMFYRGTTLSRCAPDVDLLKDRFDAEGWKYFEGWEKTKIGGIPSNPQWCDDEAVAALAGGKKTLLLQIGTDVTDDGAMHFFIKTSDLTKRRFKECEAVYGST